MIGYGSTISAGTQRIPCLAAKPDPLDSGNYEIRNNGIVRYDDCPEIYNSWNTYMWSVTRFTSLPPCILVHKQLLSSKWISAISFYCLCSLCFCCVELRNLSGVQLVGGPGDRIWGSTCLTSDPIYWIFDCCCWRCFANGIGGKLVEFSSMYKLTTHEIDCTIEKTCRTNAYRL